jgi:hypothetical protein
MRHEVMEANADRHCECCHRVHRKLYNVDGYWVGGTCYEHYVLYKQTKDVGSIVWQGYEKQHAKVARMVKGS